MRKNTQSQLLSNLYLFAVLPALTELMRVDSTANAIIKNSHFKIKISILNQEQQTITIGQGTSPRVINMLFLSHRHLNAFFKGKKWLPPILTRGCLQFKTLKTFSQLTTRLDAILQPSHKATKAHTRVAFIIAGLSVSILARWDKISNKILTELPQGLASFAIQDKQESIAFWFDNKQDAWRGGIGKPRYHPSLTLQLPNIEIANQLINNQLDTIAALCSRRMLSSGLTILADGIGFVMERADLYLRPQ